MSEYFVGVDFGFTLPWWKRILNFFRFKKYSTDYSVMTMFQREKDGTFTMIRSAKI